MVVLEHDISLSEPDWYLERYSKIIWSYVGRSYPYKRYFFILVCDLEVRWNYLSVFYNIFNMF